MITRTLAVAEHAEAVGPDLGPRAQIGEAGAHVLGEVGAGRALERAARCPRAAVVHAQHRDPAARQRIRELAEGPIPLQPDILSRSCGPDPVMVTIAPTGFALLAPLGSVSVPASVWPIGVFTDTSSAV